MSVADNHSALRLTDPIRVAIVSDVRVHCEGLVSILEQEPDIEVAAAVDNGRESLVCVLEVEPDVVLLDVAMPAEWAAAARALSIGLPLIPVVAVAFPGLESQGFASADVVAILSEAGLIGSIGRDAGSEGLLRAVRRAATGHAPTAGAILPRRSAPTAARQGPELRLTRREAEIFMLLQEGLSNKEIATHLSIAVATVKNHVHSILGKLGLTQRHDAVRVATRPPLRPRARARVTTVFLLDHDGLPAPCRLPPATVAARTPTSAFVRGKATP